jgi:hypothetical protein
VGLVGGSSVEEGHVWSSHDRLRHVVEVEAVVVEEDIDRIEDHYEDHRMGFVALEDEDLDPLARVVGEVEEVIPHRASQVFLSGHHMGHYMSEGLEEILDRMPVPDLIRLEVFRFQGISVMVFEEDIDRGLLSVYALE